MNIVEIMHIEVIPDNMDMSKEYDFTLKPNILKNVNINNA